MTMDPKIKEYFRRRGVLPEGYDDVDQEADDANQVDANMGWAKVAGQMSDNFYNSSNKDIILKNKHSALGNQPNVIEAKKQKTDFSLADSLGQDRKGAAQAKLEQMKSDMRARLSGQQADEKLEFDRVEGAQKQSNTDREFGLKERELAARQQTDKAGPNKEALSFFDKYNGHPTTKATNITREAYRKVTTSLGNPSAANDMAGVFSYMKMLDPGSTVREGEFANAQNAAGVPERVQTMYNKVLSGEILSPAQRADFMKSAQQQLAAQDESQRTIDTQFNTFGQQYGYPTDGIIPDKGGVPAPQANEKVIGGVRYRKVQGGWEPIGE